MNNVNPKDAIGSTKLPFHLIPAQALGEVALAFLEGALKYGEANWRATYVKGSIYDDASERHKKVWREGESIDPKSGVHPLAHAVANLLILLDAEMNGNLIDDRPIKAKDQRWLHKLNERAAAIYKKYPNPVPPFTEQQHGEAGRSDSHT